MTNTALVVQQTKKWITDVVIGCNFCPFAAKELRRNRVHFEVEHDKDMQKCLKAFSFACSKLDENDDIETVVLILPNAVPAFSDYLNLVSAAEKYLKKNAYEGIYQVASFHPLYRFADAPEDDAANYTNRSIYPMLHLLREESIEEALKKYPNPEQIPFQNISFARNKGIVYMKMLRDSCL